MFGKLSEESKNAIFALALTICTVNRWLRGTVHYFQPHRHLMLVLCAIQESDGPCNARRASPFERSSDNIWLIGHHEVVHLITTARELLPRPINYTYIIK